MGAASEAQVFSLFRSLITSVVLFNDQVSQRTGIGASESQVVHLLELHGPMTPGQLAQRTGLTTGAVTGVLDRLEAAELVRRRPHDTDRRKIVVTPNPARLAEVFAPLYEEQAQNLAGAIAALTEAERRAVIKFLASLVESPKQAGE